MSRTLNYITLEEALTVIAGKQISSVSYDSASRKVAETLQQAARFRYNPDQDLKINLERLYLDCGHTLLAEAGKNALEITKKRGIFWGGALNKKDIERIAKNHHLPLVLSVPVRAKDVVESDDPRPVVVRKDSLGINRVYCTRCGRELNATFSLETDDIFRYDPCPDCN